MPAAVEQLAPHCKFVATLDNTLPGAPRLVRCRELDKGVDLKCGEEEGATLSWSQIRNRFQFKMRMLSSLRLSLTGGSPSSAGASDARRSRFSSAFQSNAGPAGRVSARDQRGAQMRAGAAPAPSVARGGSTERISEEEEMEEASVP